MATSRKRTIEFEFLVKDRDAVAGLNRIEGQLSKTGSAFASMAKGVAAYVGVRELKDFAMSAIDAASRVEESMNAVNVVFGDSADAILRFADGSADAVGLSQSNFQQMAAQMGALLQGVGFSADEAATRTLELTNRAADMASIFDTDVSQAVGAIQSALKGEFNPIETFGVKLSAATVEAKALEMGLADTKKELTDTDKATAALAEIMEQTNRIAGDFAETMDSVANRSRRLTENVDDLKASIGEKLLPVWEDLLQGADDAITVFEEVAERLDDAAGIELKDGSLLNELWRSTTGAPLLLDWLHKLRLRLDPATASAQRLSDTSFDVAEKQRMLRYQVEEFETPAKSAAQAMDDFKRALSEAGQAMDDNLDYFFNFNGILWEIAGGAQEAITQMREAARIAEEVAAFERAFVGAAPNRYGLPAELLTRERIEERREREQVDTTDRIR